MAEKTLEEMREAVLFARERNVRVYVTVNTLLKDDELPEALDFCKFLCSVPVDGILIQDMGLFNILREACPEMPLHASTQMSLHTPGGAALLKELGASRVVLAREMSLKEIEEVSKKTDVELEAFVHGALCMSLSGQCYFSAMLGGRSGNRGRCAQTCRLPFAAPGGTGHDLSLKDMSFIDHIETLHNAGVCAAKIEGRMKRPEYVAAAVAACRKAADGESVPENLLEHLNAVFSRSGFTDGYLSAHRGRIMFGTRTKEDVESANSAVFAQLDPSRRAKIMEFALRQDQVIITVAAAGDVPELPGDAHAHVIDVAALKLQGSGGEGTAFMPEPLPADDPFAGQLAAVQASRRTAGMHAGSDGKHKVEQSADQSAEQVSGEREIGLTKHESAHA